MVVDTLPGAFLSVLQVGVFVTIISLFLCVPLIRLFNAYLPQLVRKPKTNGPWLKNLI